MFTSHGLLIYVKKRMPHSNGFLNVWMAINNVPKTFATLSVEFLFLFEAEVSSARFCVSRCSVIIMRRTGRVISFLQYEPVVFNKVSALVRYAKLVVSVKLLLLERVW